MATAKELLGALGFDDLDPEKVTVEELTAKHNERFVPLDGIEKNETVKTKVTGTVLGKLTTKIAQTFGLEKKDVEGKKIEELISLGKEKLDGQIGELKTSLETSSPEEIKKLNAKIEKLNADYTGKVTEYKALADTYEKDKGEWQNGLKSYKLNDKVTKVKSDITDKLSEDYSKNELVKKGFDSHFSDKYELDLDENDEIIIKDKSTKAVVKAKKEAHKNATLDEVILAEAESKGILKKNNGGVVPPVIKTNSNTGDGKEVKIHPNAQKRAQFN